MCYLLKSFQLKLKLMLPGKRYCRGFEVSKNSEKFVYTERSNDSIPTPLPCPSLSLSLSSHPLSSPLLSSPLLSSPILSYPILSSFSSRPFPSLHFPSLLEATLNVRLSLGALGIRFCNSDAALRGKFFVSFYWETSDVSVKKE